MCVAPAKTTMAARAARSHLARLAPCQATRCRASTAGAAQASGIGLETYNAAPLVAAIAATTTGSIQRGRAGANTATEQSTTNAVASARSTITGTNAADRWPHNISPNTVE